MRDYLQSWDQTSLGTNTIHWISHDDIKTIPQDRTVTYARIVVNYRPQKMDPSRVCISFGSNLITNPGELTMHTAKMTFTKVLWSARRMPSTCLQVLKKFTWNTSGQIQIQED
ncbi:hypothetical protein ACHAW6_013703 [Cyclotella cf. meneghiniana]